MKTIKSLALLTPLIALCAQASASSQFTYEMNWSSLADYTLTGTPSAQSGFFYAADSTGTWSISNGVLSGTWRTTGYQPSYTIRNFKDGNLLSAGQSLQSATVSFDSSWRWGNKTTVTQGSIIGLLNSEGNGYIATIRIGGNAVIYQVENGVTGTLTALASKTIDMSQLVQSAGPAAPGSNLYQQITFTIEEGNILLKSSVNPTDSLSVSLPTNPEYLNFTQIVVGGIQYNAENIYIDNIRVNGVVIPEAGTSAIVIGLGSAAVICTSILRRRAKPQGV